MRKTNDRFLEQIRGRNILPLEPYPGYYIKMRFLCGVCGYKWKSLPNNIIAGRGCPRCALVASAKKLRKKNTFIVNKDGSLSVDVSTKSYPNTIMLIDRRGLDVYSDSGGGRIHAAKQHGGFYAYTRLPNKKIVSVHRLLLGFPLCVDHINHDGLDNRFENLRACTQQQNAMNQPMSALNKSGKTGVHWCNKKKKWVAQIGVKGTRRYIGISNNKETAINDRLKAEDKFFGEFANKTASRYCEKLRGNML